MYLTLFLINTRGIRKYPPCGLPRLHDCSPEFQKCRRPPYEETLVASFLPGVSVCESFDIDVYGDFPKTHTSSWSSRYVRWWLMEAVVVVAFEVVMGGLCHGWDVVERVE
ncbi:hypothetical protein Tco_0303315 [Tanacetum coccineum]